MKLQTFFRWGLAPLLFFFFSFPLMAYDAALRRAMDLAYNAQFAEAESAINGYIAGHPGDPLGYIVRGTVLDWKQTVNNLRKKLDGAIIADMEKGNLMAFRLWEKDPENVEKMVNLGNSYMFLAKKWLDVGKKSRAGLILKKCQKHMEKAIAKEPNRWDAYLAIGIFNFYAANIPPGLQFIASILGISGDESQGLSQLKQAASNPGLFQAHALFVLTYAYGQTKKNYAGAETYLNQLISLYPNNPHFLYLKGEYAFRAKQYAKSRSDFDRFLAFCQSHGCAQNYDFLAHYFMTAGYIEEKNYSAAKPHLEEVEKLNVDQFPDRTVRIFYYKGLILKSEGKTKEAVEAFNKVKAMQGKNPKVWTDAQKALKEMGQL